MSLLHSPEPLVSNKTFVYVKGVLEDPKAETGVQEQVQRFIQPTKKKQKSSTGAGRGDRELANFRGAGNWEDQTGRDHLAVWC